MNNKILPEHYERVAYNNPEFPAYVKQGTLSLFPNYSAISHWHDDIEFIYIITGQMHYNVNGTRVILHQGEGIFINTRQLHYGYSPTHQECIFICILLHPVLLCSSAYIEHNFILPVLKNEAQSFIVFHPDIEREACVLMQLQRIHDSVSEDTFPLTLQESSFHIWKNLFLLSDRTQKSQMPQNQHLTTLKKMILFIENHYTEKIALEDICSSGATSKTSATSIFNRYTNQTPFSYLTEYRLKKGIDLLLSTDHTISEICLAVGFSGASYFTETFHRYYKCTPTEYRRVHLESHISF